MPSMGEAAQLISSKIESWQCHSFFDLIRQHCSAASPPDASAHLRAAKAMERVCRPIGEHAADSLSPTGWLDSRPTKPRSTSRSGVSAFKAATFESLASPWVYLLLQPRRWCKGQAIVQTGLDREAYKRDRALLTGMKRWPYGAGRRRAVGAYARSSQRTNSIAQLAKRMRTASRGLAALGIISMLPVASFFQRRFVLSNVPQMTGATMTCLLRRPDG
jgi:hypothetical protein